MKLESGCLYHIYNRGNNRQRVFFTRENYLYFLGKVEKYIISSADVLAWCLMPNHFHFLVRATERSTTLVRHSPVSVNRLTEGFRLMLSSYTKAIQIQEGLTGSLFQQKTKGKDVDEREGYATAAFHYIHQNPLRAGLVERIQDWEFSSYPDYLAWSVRGSPRSRLPIKLDDTIELLDLDACTFVMDSMQFVDGRAQSKIL
jgi:REP element-mobilizing transposase RayT